MQQTKKSKVNEIKLNELVEKFKKSKFFKGFFEYKNCYEIYFKYGIPLWIYGDLMHNNIECNFKVEYLNKIDVCLVIYKKKDYDFD